MLPTFATRSNSKYQKNYLTGILRSHIQSQYLTENDFNKTSLYRSIFSIFCRYIARFNKFSVALSVVITSLQIPLLRLLINILLMLKSINSSLRSGSNLNFKNGI